MKPVAKTKLAHNLQDWTEARKRFHLSHAHVQMARELGMNPCNLGKLDNHDQEPWKLPLKQYIEHLYCKRFGKERPDVVVTIEENIRLAREKKARRRDAKLHRRQHEMAEADESEVRNL